MIWGRADVDVPGSSSARLCVCAFEPATLRMKEDLGSYLSDLDQISLSVASGRHTYEVDSLSRGFWDLSTAILHRGRRGVAPPRPPNNAAHLFDLATSTISRSEFWRAIHYTS